MRAVSIALVGSLLFVGSAAAGECRPGAMEFRQGSKVFRVNKTGYGHKIFAGHHAERTVFGGTVSGKPFMIDIQGLQGSSTSFDSYRGMRPESANLMPRWASRSRWPAGEPLQIYSGPLAGTWQTVCR